MTSCNPKSPIRIDTQQLELRQVSLADAVFLLDLLNDPDFLQNIGDRGVRSEQQAENYLKTKVIKPQKFDYLGLWVIHSKAEKRPLGVVSVLQRDYLEHLDLGYALLKHARGKGVAYEATSAMLEYITQNRKVPVLDAIVKPDNAPSRGLLTKLGFHSVGTVTSPENEQLCLYRYRKA
ncbi:GNAT family N-acetyltransferase [Pseudidiomarina marina]|uniref:GNAT family N-acetyltransferase n=1 Tax=Pseudidiomarina marina TaxID=502366 RepID=UPI00384E32FD